MHTPLLTSEEVEALVAAGIKARLIDHHEALWAQVPSFYTQPFARSEAAQLRADLMMLANLRARDGAHPLALWLDAAVAAAQGDAAVTLTRLSVLVRHRLGSVLDGLDDEEIEATREDLHILSADDPYKKG